MKKLLLSILTITAFGFGVKAQITDLPVTANPTSVCSGGNAAISTTGSQSGVNYSLRNSANTVVYGPIAGTGNDLFFNTGAITSAETFNVFAELQSAQSALTFDGVDDFVQLSDDNRGMTNQVSFACWVQTTGVAQYVGSKIGNTSGYILTIDASGKIVILSN